MSQAPPADTSPTPPVTQVPDNLRAENQELNSYGVQVVAFRFMILSFFLATIGLVLNADIDDGEKGFVLIGIAIPIWLIELRNRVLLQLLGRRGKEIEGFWKEESSRHFEHTYHKHGEDSRPMDIYVCGIKVTVTQGQWILGKLASHGIGIDLLMAVVVAYGLYLCSCWALLAAIVVAVFGGLFLRQARKRRAAMPPQNSSGSPSWD